MSRNKRGWRFGKSLFDLDVACFEGLAFVDFFCDFVDFFDFCVYHLSMEFAPSSSRACAVDLCGARYGRYVILRPVTLGRKATVLCHCDCGTEKTVRLDGLKSGKVQSCGCLNAERRRAEKPSRQAVFSDVLHHRFGRLVATGLLREPGRATRIVCRCDCGAQSVTLASRLRNGSTTSCGCYHQERLVDVGHLTRDHGHAVDGDLACGHTSIYRAWLKVKMLCRAVERRGAGRVSGEHDPRWVHFGAFLADFGPIGFYETICRKDPQEPWSKSNCYVGLGPLDSRRKTRAENALSAPKKADRL